MKISSYQQNSTKRVLLIGLTGSGKSTLAAQLAEEGFYLDWINIENAADSLIKLSPEAQERINLINVPDSAAFPVAASTCIHIFKRGIARICDRHGNVDCKICAKAGDSFSEIDVTKHTPKHVVVLDSASQLSASILSYATKGQPVEYKPERDDWGALRKYTEYFKSQFQGAQYNLVVICQATTAELENGVEKLVPLFGSKGMSANFGSAFDHVIYLDIKNGRHKAYSSSTALPGVLTRSRSDFDISQLDRPSLAPIFAQSVDSTSRETTSVTSNPSPVKEAVTDSGTQDRLKSLMSQIKR